ILDRFGRLSCKKGTKANWGNVPSTKTNACAALKQELQELEDVRVAELEAVRRVVLMPLLEQVRGMVAAYGEERKKEGKAEFHDLLVWARDLLRQSAPAREHFQRRFSHILIDEFQDTDPIQAEIAFLLAAKGNPNGNDGRPSDWRKLPLVPGKLFVVGDPKQSIYRFRRADIAAVEMVCKLMGEEATPLYQNFRSQQPIIAWVNSVFGAWMGSGAAGIQAAYTELTHRWVPEDLSANLGVHWLGQPVKARAIQIRRMEAEHVVEVLQDICSKWKVRSPADGPLRVAEYRDVCVLMPARTCLPQLERALDQANVPYRVESQSLVLGTHDVQELLSCLRAIDSPVDQVALIAALRSSAFACSDAELLAFVRQGGRFDYTNPGGAEGPVREAMQVLHEYHGKRLWMPPDELIESFIRDRRMMEVSFGRPRPRERLRRLRLVTDRAGTFRRTAGGSLRAFLDWIERLADENVRMAENVSAETDEDAVRIMTIHSAKGLEFPVVVLIGVGNSRPSRGSVTIFDRKSRSVEVNIGSKNAVFCTAGYVAAKELEKEAGEAEDVRLMYVAATRARDHLVVSLYRKDTEDDNTLAGNMCRCVGDTPDLWREATPGSGCAMDKTTVLPEQPWEDNCERRREWLENRELMLKVASRPVSLAVTALSKVNKEEAEQGEVFFRKGRGGSNLGRAVHSVLQSVDLATGSNLDDISRAQAAGEGIPERWQEVRDLASNALASPVVKRAVASGRYHREVFVGLPVSGTVLEGFIDLLFEEPDGVVIVDYKTDSIGEEQTAAKAQHYRTQAGAYILAVQQITGKKVKEVVFVFLRPQREERLKDIVGLATDAQEAVAAATAVPS
ncbi:MAG: 3'-5' exonuclease, partial [Dehalococcoidia bacterium]|nr:3'-5' exonuclease [Dehalococcoidia bacterium]